MITVTLDPDSPVPLYVQLASLLEAGIGNGEWTSRLPSVRTLVQEHGVSHPTAERALKILVDKGLIVASPGKGYYVAPSDTNSQAT